jgi:hypothetical protein
MSGNWDKWYYFKRYYFKRESRPSYTSSANNLSPVDIFMRILGAGIVAAIGILGWQVYTYLKLGIWQSLSVITALLWLNIDWARSPHDWLGVYKVLDGMPLSLAAFLIGVAPIGVWLWWDERSRLK